MKITFPHLGNTHFAAKALFDGLGIEYIIPPASNLASLKIGSPLSPEEICLPFKIMIGNYIQSIEKGADTVLLTGSCGPCRFGEYCELQMNLMKKLGYNVEFIVLDSPGDIGIHELLNRIHAISSQSSKSKVEKLKTVQDAYKVLKLMDEIEGKARFLSGYELEKGAFKKFLKECKNEALLCSSPYETILYLKERKRVLKSLPINRNKNPLKIALIGEIYTILEPFSNLYIEDKLMDYGVSTKKYLSPSWWFKNMLFSTVNLNSLDLKKSSKKYLPFYIGGHAKECIGEAILAEKEGFDGAIQIFPMGCMPEIVSKAILPAISKEKDFPILTLIVDEMIGEAGYITRIEAFLDLLERRQNHVLYGS